MFSSASSISGPTIASTSSFHGPGQPRASNSSAPPLESFSRFTPLTVNQAYPQRVPKHRSRSTVSSDRSVPLVGSPDHAGVRRAKAAAFSDRRPPQVGEYSIRRTYGRLIEPRPLLFETLKKHGI